jgi:hypothetical protein
MSFIIPFLALFDRQQETLEESYEEESEEQPRAAAAGA